MMTTMNDTSSEQEDALKKAHRWFTSEYNQRTKPIFGIFGYAGTGKSTIAKYFADNIDGEVAYAAFTGKASLVLRDKGCVGACTIHSMIYVPKVDKKTGEVTFVKKENSFLRDAGIKLIVVDECSMVNEEIGKDLISFGVPILVLGDPGQLPPPEGAGFFTNMKPDAMLTEIHRQAKGNPILDLATKARNGEPIKIGDYGQGVSVIDKISSDILKNADQIMCGANKTRTKLNDKVRSLLGYEGEYPDIGEKLICTNNDKDLGIYNGGFFTVEHVGPHPHKNFLKIEATDEITNTKKVFKVHKSQFNADFIQPGWKQMKGSQYFDFGYCITTHKSQGSQFVNPLIYDESWMFREDSKKWLYTAITRASHNLTIFKNKS